LVVVVAKVVVAANWHSWLQIQLVSAGSGRFTELEKAEVVGFLAYGQLAIKCPASRQLKHTLELLLLLAVTWLVLLCGGFMVF
jgi:hypothetical protein